MKKQFSNRILVGSLTASGLLAAIYALQNSLLQISYKNLDSLTFSSLDQTKPLVAAFLPYLILGYLLMATGETAALLSACPKYTDALFLVTYGAIPMNRSKKDQLQN